MRPADTRSVTHILAMLSNLRADQLITDSVGDGKSFGLDHPLMEIVWETDRAHRLKVGSPVPRMAAYYANAEDLPFIFTIRQDRGTQTFGGRASRSCLVLTFPDARAERAK